MEEPKSEAYFPGLHITHSVEPAAAVMICIKAAANGSIHLFKVERRPFFDARGPARGDRFGAGVEPERIWPVLVQIAKG